MFKHVRQSHRKLRATTYIPVAVMALSLCAGGCTSELQDDEIAVTTALPQTAKDNGCDGQLQYTSVSKEFRDDNPYFLAGGQLSDVTGIWYSDWEIEYFMADEPYDVYTLSIQHDIAFGIELVVDDPDVDVAIELRDPTGALIEFRNFEGPGGLEAINALEPAQLPSVLTIIAHNVSTANGRYLLSVFQHD